MCHLSWHISTDIMPVSLHLHLLPFFFKGSLFLCDLFSSSSFFIFLFSHLFRFFSCFLPWQLIPSPFFFSLTSFLLMKQEEVCLERQEVKERFLSDPRDVLSDIETLQWQFFNETDKRYFLISIFFTFHIQTSSKHTGQSAGIKIETSPSSSSDDFTIHVLQSSLVGSKVKIPCDVSLPPTSDTRNPSLLGMESNTITLILWYRGDRTSSPIYSLDARSSPDLLQAKHHVSSDAFRGRIKFELPSSSPSNSSLSQSSLRPSPPKSLSVQSSSLSSKKQSSSASTVNSLQQQQQQLSYFKAFLVLDPVREEDAGVFLCRVDFKWARTLNTVTNFTVNGKSLFFFFAVKDTAILFIAKADYTGYLDRKCNCFGCVSWERQETVLSEALIVGVQRWEVLLSFV